MTSAGSFDALDRFYSAASGWIYLFDGAGERIAKFPDNSVLRREMAKLVVQARQETKQAQASCPGTQDTYFPDVACTDPDRIWIDRAHEDGILNGNFGPGDTITREQMAKFIVLALNQSPATGCDPNNLTFADVPCTDPLWGYVQRIYLDGITLGCGDGTNFCPAYNVPESQMMAFTNRAWSGFQFVPRGTFYTLRDPDARLVTEMLSTPGSTSTPNDFPVSTTPTRDNVFLGNLLVASQSSNTLGGTIGWTYYHPDHLGTPRLVTGVEGPILLKYWPYGDEVSTNGATSQRLKFAAMERDSESNRFFDHARMMDFNLGRFISRDVLGGAEQWPLTLNRYAYVIGNPVNLVDPTGFGGEPNPSSAEEQNPNYILVTAPFWQITTAEQALRGFNVLQMGSWEFQQARSGGSGQAGAHSRERNGSTSAWQCFLTNRFGRLPEKFGAPELTVVADALEILAPTSAAGDVAASSFKATRVGIGGSTSSYASGLNYVLRRGAEFFGNPGVGTKPVKGLLTNLGNVISPPLRVVGAFAAGYDLGILVQCALGTLP
jgi:RHS repeat-associated protein